MKIDAIAYRAEKKSPWQALQEVMEGNPDRTQGVEKLTIRWREGRLVPR
jgi:hypothetical protein